VEDGAMTKTFCDKCKGLIYNNRFAICEKCGADGHYHSRCLKKLSGDLLCTKHYNSEGQKRVVADYIQKVWRERRLDKIGARVLTHELFSNDQDHRRICVTIGHLDQIYAARHNALKGGLTFGRGHLEIFIPLHNHEKVGEKLEELLVRMIKDNIEATERKISYHNEDHKKIRALLNKVEKHVASELQ
jgi:hypothetical protein